jgi:uncharacterized membrane-anchored protein
VIELLSPLDLGLAVAAAALGALAMVLVGMAIRQNRKVPARDRSRPGLSV